MSPSREGEANGGGEERCPRSSEYIRGRVKAPSQACLALSPLSLLRYILGLSFILSGLGRLGHCSAPTSGAVPWPASPVLWDWVTQAHGLDRGNARGSTRTQLAVFAHTLVQFVQSLVPSLYPHTVRTDR